MKPFQFQRPWLLTVRGIALVVMGLVAILQNPNTLQPLLLIFALLYGFNIFLTLIETLILKRTKLSGLVLASFILNILLTSVLLLAFSRYDSPNFTIEKARSFSLYMIFLTLFFAFITDLVEWIALIQEKTRFSSVFLINTILTLMMAIFLYSFIDGLNAIELNLFGYMAIGTGCIFFVIHALLSNISKLVQEQKDEVN